MTSRLPNSPQLSLQLPSFSQRGAHDWAHLLTLARAADVSGFDRVLVGDHVVFGNDLDAYGDPSSGGRAGGRQLTGPDGAWLEPLTLLAVIAGQISRVRLGTNVLLAALRRPVVLAKAVSTLDVLSSGRVDLGVGVGWQRAEYDAAGLDFQRRGRLLDHSLEVCLALWNQSECSYQSGELQFSGIHQMPKPAQLPSPPIWVSGTANPRAMRRLATFGAGWIAWGDDDVKILDSIPRMRGAMALLGRDPSSVGVSATLPTKCLPGGAWDFSATMDRAAEYAEAGVTDFRASAVNLPVGSLGRVPMPEKPEHLEETLAGIAQRFRRSFM